jgi:glycosyltransferase involved in cell wall biosynthesis
VGTPASRQDDLRRRAERLGVEVELPGWVTDERLRELYRGARAVVAPSKFESYAGLQVLEGMALGTPAIALDAPGVTEALEGRAILIGREDFNELADALVRIRDDEALRVHLAARGRELAHGLTWERAAAGFAAAFRKVLERGRESR